MLGASRPIPVGVNLVRRILREAAVARVPECAAGRAYHDPHRRGAVGRPEHELPSVTGRIARVLQAAATCGVRERPRCRSFYLLSTRSRPTRGQAVAADLMSISLSPATSPPFACANSIPAGPLSCSQRRRNLRRPPKQIPFRRSTRSRGKLIAGGDGAPPTSRRESDGRSFVARPVQTNEDKGLGCSGVTSRCSPLTRFEE